MENEQEKKQPETQASEMEAGEQETVQPQENTGKEKKKKKEKASEEKEALSRLQLEFEEHKQQHLRVLAEYDNFRKKALSTTMLCPIRCRRSFQLQIISNGLWSRKMLRRRICARAWR